MKHYFFSDAAAAVCFSTMNEMNVTVQNFGPDSILTTEPPIDECAAFWF